MSIINAFNDYFEMVPATSDALKQEVYKLRYQVYCVEKGFEDSNAHPDGLEHDDYDSHSSHYLIRHRETDCYMATTRLILPCTEIPKKLFPTEVHSQINNIALLQTMHRDKLAELSRFCVSKQFRRRKNEQHLLVTNDIDDHRFSPRETGSSAHLTLALLACTIRMSFEHNIHYWYAMIDPKLKPIFSALGIDFVEIGPLAEYHGTCVPCVIKMNDLLGNVAKKNLDYWNMLTNKGVYQF